MGLMMKDVVHSRDKEHIFYLIIGKNKVVGIALIKSEILCKLLVGIYIYNIFISMSRYDRSASWPLVDKLYLKNYHSNNNYY